MRIAQLKFMSTGLADNLPRAVSLLLEHHVIPHGERLDTLRWLRQRVFSKDIVDAFEPHMTLLRKLYDSTASVSIRECS